MYQKKDSHSIIIMGSKYPREFYKSNRVQNLIHFILCPHRLTFFIFISHIDNLSKIESSIYIYRVYVYTVFIML